MEPSQMELSIDTGTKRQPRTARIPAALGRWTRDARTPSLRLTPQAAELPPPDMTSQFPVVDMQSKPGRQTVIQLHPVQARETMPFMARTTACPYLECRQSNRRCLSADPAPVSLERQVRHCFSQDHRTCKYYRKARGLPAVPPTHAAFYTAAAVTVILFLYLAGLS